ncbi:MAG TPA: hypothetical protein VLB82_09725 [Thermodesulfobacteriota bacterium]|nr:hypothetical protein [Thermodesulfobacteriota bacterium]
MNNNDPNYILNTQLSSFGSEIANVLVDSNFIMKSFRYAQIGLEKESKNLKKFFDKIDDQTNTVPYISMWTAVVAKDVTKDSTDYLPIQSKTVGPDEILTIITDYLNQQLLWLIVKAYESFERFNKDFYACLGYTNRDLWLCSDFGKYRIGDLENKELDWYKAQVRKNIGKNNIKDILKRYRDIFHEYEKFERQEPDNLLFWIKFIEFVRHTIVHANSSVQCSELNEKLEKFTGVAFPSRKPELEKDQKQMIEYFTQVGEIYKLQVIDKDKLDIPDATVTYPTKYIIEKLTSHAYLTYKTSLEFFV